MYQTLLTELDGNIFIITVNRPDKLNALNRQVMDELNQVIDEACQNNAIRAVIITGSGTKAFIAGADITEFMGLDKKQGQLLAKKGQDIFFKIENASKPIVAAINGFALGGGCELSMACHFRLCSSNAKFGQPEVNLGLIPGYGGTQRLTQLIGKGKAMELMMTGSMIPAEEALQLGLVNYITTPETLLSKAKEILETIANKAPLAIAKVIECVNVAQSDGKNGFEKEQEAFAACFATNDMKEGVTAFLEKRKPDFKGN
ncbi:MAG TPA: enoyl-CoA hydratase-related protein [Puia sp.]|nr:enoyl-CoA hydratase-related protein [Puia sp.]